MNPSFLDAPVNFTAKIKQKHFFIKCKLCKKIMNVIPNHVCFISYTQKRKKQQIALDLQRHCGVITDTDGEPCRNALSCRLHNVDEKRKVLGRLFNLDVLAKIQKKKKEKVKEIVEIDDEIKEIIAGIKPVVNKIWHSPAFKYESIGIKSLFYVGKRHQMIDHKKKN
ncbi:Ataxin 7-like [Conglomerata obtusa]